jgi:hypothetical protein
MAAFLTALPQILNLLFTLFKLIKNGVDAASVLKSLNNSLSLLATAKTQEEYTNAAKSLADTIASFPSKQL